MATPAEIITARAAAGAAYAAAAQAYVDAWKELAGYDAVTGNSKVRGCTPSEQMTTQPEVAPHPVFLNSAAVGTMLNNISGKAQQRGLQLLGTVD